MNTHFEKILSDRELRHERLLELSKDYGKTLVCGGINYPGANKTTEQAEKAFEVLKVEMATSLNSGFLRGEIWSGSDGQAFIAVIDEDPRVLKRKTMMMEEQHPLGRLFDIDVIDTHGDPISRQGMDTEGRRCILCGAPVLECMISGKHAFSEVLDHVNRMIETYVESDH